MLRQRKITNNLCLRSYVDAGTQNIVLTLSKEIALNDGRKAILGVDMQISNINEFLNAIGQDTVDAETSATLSKQ